jgi:2-hydroxymuconate-semialdehyde hydrolase
MPGVNALTWSFMRRRSMVRASLRSLLHRTGALTDDLVEKAMAEVLRPGAGKAWMAFQNHEMLWSGLRTSYMNRVKEITVPVLIVHGTQDNLVPRDASQEAHVRIPGSRLHWVDGAGHWPQRDHPKDFNRAVSRFLNESVDELVRQQ